MGKYKNILLLIAVSFCSFGCESRNNYSVQMRDGVPFMNVNGKPIRARLFYGNVVGSNYDKISPETKTVTLNLKTDVDTTALLQMNFGAPIKNIEIFDISLINKKNGEKISLLPKSPTELQYCWTQKSLEAWRDLSEPVSKVAPNQKKYPTPPYKAEVKNNTLHIEKDFVDMSIPKNRRTIHDIERLNFVIENIKLKAKREYEILLKLRANEYGRFEVSLFAQNDRTLLATNTKETFMSQQKFAAERGVDFITFGIPAFWNDDPIYKQVTDTRFKAVIDANPNAKIIVRLGLEPPNWWLDKNKDELMCSTDGVPIERMHVRYPTPSSEIYRRDAMEAMRKFIEYVEEKYPDNIAGYHPSGGNSSEWFYGGTFQDGFHGYDKATQKAWRKWLAKKYVDNSNLQKAWRNPNAKIKEAVAPSPEERFDSNTAILNPTQRAAAIDFNLFLQDEMSDILLLAAKTIRKYSPQKRLCVVFYGYGFGFANTPKGPAYSGHYALRKLLDSPDIDMFTAPIAYDDRLLGGIKRSSNPSESALLAGKLWIDEDDNRTWLAPISGSPPYYLDPSQKERADTIKVMRRNMVHQSLKNMGSWWMDLFGCGWFNDKKLWNVMDEFKNIEKDFRDSPKQFAPEIALTYDEKSLCYIAGIPHPKKTTSTAVYELPNPVSQSGVPYGQYMLEDILEGRVNAKLNYISGSYALTKKQRIQLRELAKKSSCAYIWNVGYVDLEKAEFSLDTIYESTGFEVELLEENTQAEAIPTELGKCEGIEKFGLEQEVAPLFSPIPEEGDKIIATYPNGKPAVVARKVDGHTQVFIGVTKLSPELCKYIAKISGVHSYVDNNAVAVANGNYVAIHTTKDGAHTINLKEECNVFDVFENKELGKFKTKSFNLKMGDVKLFKLSR